jgi:hypothetical protein
VARLLVFAAFIALIVAGVFIFPPGKSLGSFVLYTVILGLLLALVCWLKGEPPARALRRGLARQIDLPDQCFTTISSSGRTRRAARPRRS